MASIEIPSSVTTIDSGVFYGCSGLASIEIPSSVTSIGDYAFLSCSNLRSINYTDTKEKWNAITKGYAWNKNTGNYTIRCTDGDISKLAS